MFENKNLFMKLEIKQNFHNILFLVEKKIYIRWNKKISHCNLMSTMMLSVLIE